MKTDEELADRLFKYQLGEGTGKEIRQRIQSAIESRDAEIHQMYAPVVEALKATPALRMQNGPHKGLMRLELFLDESTLAAIKEVKGWN